MFIVGIELLQLFWEKPESKCATMTSKERTRSVAQRKQQRFNHKANLSIRWDVHRLRALATNQAIL